MAVYSSILELIGETPIVDVSSVERFFPQADPAPWAGNTRVASGNTSNCW